MDKQELQDRTKIFALDVIRLCKALPKNQIAYVITNQVLRSATSVAANYRAACRSRSKAEFIAKLGTVIEEADETHFWLELIVDSKLVDRKIVDKAIGEANELVAIMVASRKSASKNSKPKI